MRVVERGHSPGNGKANIEQEHVAEPVDRILSGIGKIGLQLLIIMVDSHKAITDNAYGMDSAKADDALISYDRVAGKINSQGDGVGQNVGQDNFPLHESVVRNGVDDHEAQGNRRKLQYVGDRPQL